MSSNQPQQQQEQDKTKQQQQTQDLYQTKCDLLEYHLKEAVLINKALRSDIQEYKEKIEFEKNLRKYLSEQAGITRNSGVIN